jgi:hypothetical protein
MCFVTSYPQYSINDNIKNDGYFSLSQLGGGEFEIVGGFFLNGNQCCLPNDEKKMDEYDSFLIKKEKYPSDEIKKDNEVFDTIFFEDRNQFFEFVKIKLKKIECSYQQVTNVFYISENTSKKFLYWVGNK